MTRTAPLVTLLAVGVLGGALFAANAVGLPAAAPAAVSAAAPVLNGSRTEIALSDVPVAGAPGGRTEISLSDIAVAPPAPAPALSDTAYAGRTADRASTVAVAVKDGKAVAYVCDNADLEVWLQGSAEGGDLDLQDKAGTATMTGRLDADGAEGTVTVDGTDYAYSASAVDVATAVGDGRPDVGDVARRAGLDTP